MSSDRQRLDDESPSTSNGNSDADQRDPAASEPEEQEERKPATQQKKNTKLSSKTTAKLSTSSTKRIQKELAEITLDPPPNCTAGPKGDNIYEWKSTILGPPGSVYEAGAFFLDLTFSSDYPFRPPKVTFHTRIYHCNSTSQGAIRLDALKDNCSPALTISKVFLSICSLLTDCNAADPLVGSIDTQYLTNTAEHDRVTRRDQETRNIIHVICMQREGAEVSSHCAAIFTAVTTWTSVYVMLILLLPLSSGDSP